MTSEFLLTVSSLHPVAQVAAIAGVVAIVVALCWVAINFLRSF